MHREVQVSREGRTTIATAGGSAPKVGALGDAGSNCRKIAEEFFNKRRFEQLCVFAVMLFVYEWNLAN
jgi:hypothetical protein